MYACYNTIGLLRQAFPGLESVSRADGGIKELEILPVSSCRPHHPAAMATPEIVHLSDIQPRPNALKVWEKYRHSSIHWFAECLAEFVSEVDSRLKLLAD